MPDIQAVLFDYGLVLSGPPDPTAWATFNAILGSGDPAFDLAYWAHRNAYDSGALNAVAYWHHVADDLSHVLTPHELTALIETDIDLWTQPNQPMIDWAAKLQAAGIKTGILSNIGDAMETGILARCAWLNAFTHHTFSHRLHIAKPAAEIYAHAAAGLQEPPSRILFIDDREENITAARADGMTAILYPDHPTFLASMQAAGLTGLLKP